MTGSRESTGRCPWCLREGSEAGLGRTPSRRLAPPPGACVPGQTHPMPCAGRLQAAKIPAPGRSTTMQAQSFDRELDVRGLNCPLPILRAKKVLGDLSPGQVLKV